MRKLWLVSLAVLTAVVLAACGGKESGNEDTVKVKIGVNGADGVQWPIVERKSGKRRN